MNSYLLFAAIICYLSNYTETKCLDSRGVTVQENESFVPISNNCMKCTCTNDEPANCEKVDCSIPITYECSKLAYGRSCCAFMCRSDEELEETNDYLLELNRRDTNKHTYFKDWKNRLVERFQKFFYN